MSKAPRKSKIWSDIYDDPTDSVVWDENQLIKSLNHAIGVHKDGRYVGCYLPKKVQIVKGKEIFKTQKMLPFIVLLEKANKKEEHRINFFELSPSFQRDQRVKFKLMPERPEMRWSLKHLKFLKEKNLKEDVNPFEDIKKLYQQCVFFLQQEWYLVHPLWDIGTYFFDLFPVYPYFEMTGLEDCAKTKVAELSHRLTFNASKILVDPKESQLFRVSDMERGTMYLDEIETLLQRSSRKSSKNDDRAEILNSGYKKGGYVGRQHKDDFNQTIYYDTYCPKMIIGKSGIEISTLKGRCITHTMTRAPKDDKRMDIEVLQLDEEIFANIRNKLYLYALKNWKSILYTFKHMENDTKLKSRYWHVWKPLLALAKTMDAKLYHKVKEFAEKISHVKKVSRFGSDSWEFKFLKAFHLVLEERGGIEDKYYLKDIREKLLLVGFSEEYLPANRTIARHLDRMGFIQYKDDDRTATFYRLGKEVFENIVSLIGCKLSPHTPHTPHLPIKEEEIKDDSVEINSNNVEIERSKCGESCGDGDILTGGNNPLIHLSCSKCGKSPCSNFDRDGKPLCERCME